MKIKKKIVLKLKKILGKPAEFGDAKLLWLYDSDLYLALISFFFCGEKPTFIRSFSSMPYVLFSSTSSDEHFNLEEGNLSKLLILIERIL